MAETGSRLRVTINYGACTGHGRCYQLAPDIFEPDEEDRGRVRAATFSLDKAELIEKAVRLCPELAISVEPAS